jgi:TPR repeat protein
MAQFNLGNAYNSGLGLEVDQDKAVHYWRLAAEQDVAEAQFNLGSAYFNGQGVEKDMAQAIEWWRKASELGFPQAIENIRLLEGQSKH